MLRRIAVVVLVLVLLSLGAGPTHAQRQVERLGRGVVAIADQDGSMFVSWRLLGTDAESTAFNVYRLTGDKVQKLNDKPIADVTSFIDRQSGVADPAAPAGTATDARYLVRTVPEDRTGEPSVTLLSTAKAAPRQYISVPLQTPDGYRPNDASVGDLDGDGEYEIVVHQVGRGRDNSQTGTTTEPILEAYRLDGKLLWRINLGRNIREGAHYTQFMVFDLDGDGRAEVACKTADGTVDGTGQVIGVAEANYRNDRGYILDGPEYLTVFDGPTGAALATTDYIPARG